MSYAINKKKTIEKLTYFIFSIYIMTLFINSTSSYLNYNYVEKVIKIIRYSCYLFFVLKAAYVIKLEKGITINNLVFLIVSALILILGKNSEFLILYFIINALRDVDFRKLAKINIIMYGVLFFSTILLGAFEIVPNWIYYRKELKRYSLGFLYPTDLMSIYVTIVLLYFYLKNVNAKYIELISLEIINIILYMYTNGRLGFFISSAIILLMLFMKIINVKYISNKVVKLKESKIVKKLKKVLIAFLKTLPIILFIIAIVISLLYKYNLGIVKIMNNILSNRIHWNYHALSEYPIKLFGSNITWYGWGGHLYTEIENFKYNYVDMSYIRIIFDYGLIGTIFILYTYKKAIKHFINDKILLICISIILIWAFVEPIIFYIGRNLFIVLIGKAFIESNDNELITKDNIKRILSTKKYKNKE